MAATVQRLPKPPVSSGKDAGPVTLIDELLAEQKSLRTPVAEFSEARDRAPDLEDHYRRLIPLTKPGSGEQYAFEVSLDRCTGCKACVSACHSLNGLDDDEAWRDTGVLLGGAEAPGWQQTVTTACHHCGDPGCLNGCPVAAYEKEEDTGIVRHLDDQCIGCSYCILKCPYDVPKYSPVRGIVRKCDMCRQRLAEGEAPACVQACPTEAIRIVTVKRREAGEEEGGELFSREPAVGSAVPKSSLTLPTTRYLGRDVPATAHAGDREALIVQHAHWPLVFMLALTQAGIGLCAGGVGGGMLFAGAMLFYAGMGASVLHLGQPLKAWRFFLGLRTSWLSREILAFSLFAPLPGVLCGLALLPDFPFRGGLQGLAEVSVLPAGMAAVLTSVMIYVDTGRSFWRLPLTSGRFFGTVLVFLLAALSVSRPWLRPLAALAVCGMAVPEFLVLRLVRGKGGEWSPDRHSAKLMTGPLKGVLLARFVLAALAAAVVLISPWAAVPLLLAAAVMERRLFFQAVQSPKMPGNAGTGPDRGN